MQKKHNEQDRLWGKIVSRCWADEAFKQRFINEPAVVLKEAGLEVPEGISLKILENTDEINYIILPAQQDELSDAQLDSVAGGRIQNYDNYFLF